MISPILTNVEDATNFFHTTWKNTGYSGLNFGLLGDVGSGKTHFVRTFFRSFSPETVKLVASPTYSYCHVYQSKSNEIHHYDLYRVKDSFKLWEIGLPESMENDLVLTFIEWPELFPKILKQCSLKMEIRERQGQKEYIF